MASTSLHGRLKLLLVDDCVEERDLYELALQQDFAILTAARGTEGLALAQHTRPDAIVLDVNMPGLDGWDTCTELKSNAMTADIPIILLTGATDCDLTQHARAVGASALLRKPCAVDILRAGIFSVVAHRVDR